VLLEHLTPREISVGLEKTCGADDIGKKDRYLLYGFSCVTGLAHMTGPISAGFQTVHIRVEVHNPCPSSCIFGTGHPKLEWFMRMGGHFYCGVIAVG
jgi:hypothetical protein